MSCNSCELLRINGVVCHEIGCPDAWRDYERACFVCGCDFPPEDRHATICDDCRRDAEDGAAAFEDDGEDE